MNDEHDTGQAAGSAQERQAWRAGFLARLSRYKTQLARHWWLPILVIGVSLAVQLSRWWLEKPLYLSSGRLMVNLKLSLPEGSLYTEELNNFLGTQAALMQSAAVLQRAHQRLGESLADFDTPPVALKTLILPKTTIFVLQGTGQDSQYTQRFVQTCMEEYISFKREMRDQTSGATLAGMTEEAVRLEKELRKCDQDLVAFQSSNSLVFLQEQGNAAGNVVAGLNQRLAAIGSECALLESLTLDQHLERQGREGGVGAGGDPSNSFSQVDYALSDADYVRARQQLLLLKSEKDDLALYLRPKHPKIIALNEEIARRERVLAIVREQSAEQLENQKDSLKRQIAALERQVRDWNVQALEISRKGAEFQRLKANSQRTQALYDRLLGTMQTLDVNKQISPESVTIIERASPAVAERAGLSRKLLFGALAGFGLSFAVLMLLDRMDDRVSSVSELQDLFDEEVLGQIPREKSALRKGEPGLLQPKDERYAFVEAYRSLRSSLLYMTEPAQRPKTILVTSSVPNDGKSLTAANLAITLAGAGARVLLVDADLRKGSLHHRFGLGTGVPGLSDVLGNEQATVDSSQRTNPGEWSAAVQATKIPNLFLLPRGSTTQNSSELFLSPLSIRFLEQSVRSYDFVILDSAPVMAADDVTSLAPHVDGVVFVVRAEHTSARVARAALDLLYLRRVRVLGLVFNAVRPTSADYYYYYKYKDYHHSYPTA